MKFFVAFALIVAVASADYTKPIVTAEQAELQEIIAAINSPYTNPATAAALEQMLLDVLGIEPQPVAVGPAMIEEAPVSVGPAVIEGSPVAIGPAVIDFPVPVESPAVPEPVVIAPTPTSAPLVQIILNINQASVEVSPVVDTPVVRPEPVNVPEPIQIVDNWPVVQPVSPISPVDVVDTAPVEITPVQVVDIAPVEVSPVEVVDVAPVAIAPVIIGTPIMPAPVVILPDELN